jgi:hypothetical protein
LGVLNYQYNSGKLVRGPFAALIDLFLKDIAPRSRQLVTGAREDYLLLEGTANALPSTVRMRTGLPMHPEFLVPMKRMSRVSWARLTSLHWAVDVELAASRGVAPRDLANFISQATRVRESTCEDF